MNVYCLGLIRSLDGQQMLLIEKQRPAFQQGKLNGIGGKVEPGETPRAAMVRECDEECALAIPAEAWEEVGRYGDGQHFEIWVYAAQTDLAPVRSLTDEPVCVVPFPLDPTLPLVPDLEAMVARLA